MRIRLKGGIVECSSIRISKARLNSSKYILTANSNDRLRVGYNEFNLTSDYSLHFHHCEQLLDIIHVHFDAKPHSIFDFRGYQIEKSYLKTIGYKAETFSIEE